MQFEFEGGKKYEQKELINYCESIPDGKFIKLSTAIENLKTTQSTFLRFLKRSPQHTIKIGAFRYVCNTKTLKEYKKVMK